MEERGECVYRGKTIFTRDASASREPIDRGRVRTLGRGDRIFIAWEEELL